MKYENSLKGFASALGLLAAVATAQADEVKIAIANFGEHTQLGQVIDGFRAQLAEAGYVEGENAEFNESHTNFDTSLLPQMIATLQSDQPDLIFAITTPVAQVALNATDGSGLPIVFGAVTDPVAAKLVPSWEEGGASITGASDLQDIAAILAFTKKLFPDAERIGLPYNPGEANDVALLEVFETEAAEIGLEVAPVGIDNVNDIQQRVSSLAGKVDVIFVPASNLIQPALPAVAAAARQIGVPIVNTTDEGISDGIVAASLSVSYEQVGRNAGTLAAQVLKGADPSTLAPTRPTFEDHTPVISRAAMDAVGAAIPADMADCDCIVE